MALPAWVTCSPGSFSLPRNRCHAGHRSMEHGVGSVLRSFPHGDRSVFCLRSESIQERLLCPEIYGIDQYCFRRINHAHVCSWHPPAHSGCAEGRSVVRGDHVGVADLRFDGRPSLRQRRSDTGRNTHATSSQANHLLICLWCCKLFNQAQDQSGSLWNRSLSV